MLLALTSTVTSFGCEGNHGKNGIMEQQQFVDIYASILAGTEYSDIGASDTVPTPRTLKIISDYGTTLEQFKETIAYYNENPAMWKTFYQKVIIQLEKKGDAKNS